MITLSKTEIGWIIRVLKRGVEENRRIANDENALEIHREMSNLRAENLSAVIEKLNTACGNNHKRIAIR